MTDFDAVWSHWVSECGLSAAQKSYALFLTRRPDVSYLTRRPKGRG